MKTSFSGIFFGFICMGIGCFFLAGTWGAYLDYNRVQDYSGRASGHVTKKHFQTAADGSGNYYLDYWFVPSSGSKISARGDISKQQGCCSGSPEEIGKEESDRAGADHEDVGSWGIGGDIHVKLHKNSTSAANAENPAPNVSKTPRSPLLGRPWSMICFSAKSTEGEDMFP